MFDLTDMSRVDSLIVLNKAHVAELRDWLATQGRPVDVIDMCLPADVSSISLEEFQQRILNSFLHGTGRVN